MSLKARTLISGRAVVTVSKTAHVREAIAIMVDNDFTQLPVVDGEGRLCGMFTEHDVLAALLGSNGDNNLLTCAVEHYMQPAVSVTGQSDVFAVLALLRDVAAVVVVRSRKPIGVVTHFDTTQYFRGMSEWLVYTAEIETGLREFIVALYPTKEAITAALFHVFRGKKDDPTKPNREFDELSMDETIRFICHEEMWSHFEPYLSPKDLFKHRMEYVRDVRNQLCHFRRTPGKGDVKVLSATSKWLQARPRPPIPEPSLSETI